jgi:hypothetical protein
MRIHVIDSLRIQEMMPTTYMFSGLHMNMMHCSATKHLFLRKQWGNNIDEQTRPRPTLLFQCRQHLLAGLARPVAMTNMNQTILMHTSVDVTTCAAGNGNVARSIIQKNPGTHNMLPMHVYIARCAFRSEVVPDLLHYGITSKKSIDAFKFR